MTRTCPTLAVTTCGLRRKLAVTSSSALNCPADTERPPSVCTAGPQPVSAIKAKVATAQDKPAGAPDHDAMMQQWAAYMKAGPEHEMLKEHFAGTWNCDVTNMMSNEKSTGTCVNEVLMDGRYIQGTFNGTAMGQPFKGMSMTGYDNVTGKYWATWNDSMSTGIMVSEGTCDAKHTCTFTGSWNDPIKKAPVKARMVSRVTGPTTEVFEMYGPGKDGKEMKMMEITYTKK